MTDVTEQDGDRPGYGRRHPAVTAFLARHRAVATTPAHTALHGRPLRLRIGAHPAAQVRELTLLVSSVRCIVTVGGSVVACEGLAGTHVWPGGRLRSGETFADTAVREVHEETGWAIAADSIRPLGVLHYEHLEPRPEGYAFLYPDYFQVVVSAVPAADAVPSDPTWRDLDGKERGARLVPVPDAAALAITDVQRAFIELLPRF